MLLNFAHHKLLCSSSFSSFLWVDDDLVSIQYKIFLALLHPIFQTYVINQVQSLSRARTEARVMCSEHRSWVRHTSTEDILPPLAAQSGKFVILGLWSWIVILVLPILAVIILFNYRVLELSHDCVWYNNSNQLHGGTWDCALKRQGIPSSCCYNLHVSHSITIPSDWFSLVFQASEFTKKRPAASIDEFMNIFSCNFIK